MYRHDDDGDDDNNKGVHLSNAMLVMEIFCYRYSTINNSAKK